MPDWLAIVKRLFRLYNVKTQAELTMAMGMPVNFGTENPLGETGIPWKILEKTIHDHHVDWNWLMTGTGKAPAATAAVDAVSPNEETLPPNRHPQYNTRDLQRTLLYPDLDKEGGRTH